MNNSWSLRTLSRIGGVLYLIIIAGGVFGEAFIRNRIIVPSDPAATVANLRAHEALWRFGTASEFFMLACSVVLALILYVLLRPVNREVAMLAVFFNLVCIAIEATNELRLAAAWLPLGSSAYLDAFTTEQLHAMVNLSMRAYSHGFAASLIFFGCECVVLGYLLYKSAAFPRAVGVLMQLAGWSYLINSFALFVAPPLARQLFPAIMLPPLIGETALCLWLLRGVRGEPEPADVAPAGSGIVNRTPAAGS